MPTKSKKNGRQNHDWGAMQAEYISDPHSSFQKIADKYGICKSAVARKAKAENWFATKQLQQEENVTESVSKVAQDYQNVLSQEIKSVMNLSDRIANVLTDDPDQFNRHILQYEEPVETKNGKVGIKKEPIEVIYEKLDTKAMKDIAQCIKLIEDMKRSMQDIQRSDTVFRQQLERERFEFDKEMQRERLEIEKERIALERERNALRSGNMGAEDDSKYGVVLIPERSSSDE